MAKLNKIMPPRNTTIRGQDHLLAYITPEEAQLLMDNGGSGEPGPMGIPQFAPGSDDKSAGQSVSSGPGDTHDADLADSTGAQVGSIGLGDIIGGYFNASPFGMAVNAIGGFLDSTVGLEAHGPDSGGGTGGDGYDSVSPLAKFYGYGGGGGGYNQYTPPATTSPAAGLMSAPQAPSSGGYARMGLLDERPSGLADFVTRYGLTGYSAPEYDAQNLAFRRQGAVYPEFFKQPRFLQDYTNINTGKPYVAAAPAVASSASPAVASSAAPAGTSGTSGAAGAFPESYVLNGTNFTPAGGLVATIAGLGIDDPVIAAADKILGPASGDVWERAFNTAALLPTPPRYDDRGKYIEGLIQASRGYPGKAVPIRYQDDAGRTTGVTFMIPEGDN